MRKWLGILGLLIPLAMVGTVIGQDAPQRTPKQGIVKEESSKEGQIQPQTQGNYQTAPKAPSTATQPAAPAYDDPAETNRQNLQIQRWLMYFTGGLVGVGFLQVVLIGWQAALLRRTREEVGRQANSMEVQAGHMEDQSKTLRESVAAAQKAADAAEISAKAAMGVAVPTLMISQFEFGLREGLDWETILKNPSVLISFKNYGRSPAILKAYATQFTSQELPPTPDYPCELNFDVGTAVEAGGTMPLEKDGVTPWGTFSVEEVHEIVNGRRYLTVYGYVKYGDVFGPTIHELQFCRTAGGIAEDDPFWVDVPYPGAYYSQTKAENQPEKAN